MVSTRARKKIYYESAKFRAFKVQKQHVRGHKNRRPHDQKLPMTTCLKQSPHKRAEEDEMQFLSISIHIPVEFRSLFTEIHGLNVSQITFGFVHCVVEFSGWPSFAHSILYIIARLKLSSAVFCFLIALFDFHQHPFA